MKIIINITNSSSSFTTSSATTTTTSITTCRIYTAIITNATTTDSSISTSTKPKLMSTSCILASVEADSVMGKDH